MKLTEWGRVFWTVALLTVIGGVLGSLVGVACDGDCTAEDRERCAVEWAQCASDGGTVPGCGAAYCDCLEALGCRGSCDWQQACGEGFHDGTDADGGI